jgi:hypothetical protein
VTECTRRSDVRYYGSVNKTQCKTETRNLAFRYWMEAYPNLASVDTVEEACIE